MRVQELSLGWQTDLIGLRAEARISEHADCIAVCCDDNPGFYWGNCLVLPSAPGDAELAHWLARFDQLVAAGRPAVRHVAIGIDAPRGGRGGDLPAWQAEGFSIDDTTTLALQPGGLEPAPSPLRADGAALRQIDFARELDTLLDLQCLDSGPFDPAGYRQFMHRQMLAHDRLAQRGQGAWFGIWCGDRLVAQCGLIRDRAEPGALGRFQHVSTHPDWRRQGLCTALVHGVSAWGFAHWQLAQAVLCADPHDVAIGIYRVLGYRPVGARWHLQRNAPQDRPAGARDHHGSESPTP